MARRYGEINEYVYLLKNAEENQCCVRRPGRHAAADDDINFKGRKDFRTFCERRPPKIKGIACEKKSYARQFKLQSKF